MTPKQDKTSYQQLVQFFSDTLLEGDQRRLKKQLAGLIRENAQLTHPQAMGFIHQGVHYQVESGTPMVRNPGLARSMEPAMEAWMQDRDATNTEGYLIRQMIYTLLHRAKTLQEMRDALPECLVDLHPEMAKMPRIQEAAFTLQGEKREMRQYLKVLPKIEIYAATRMMF